MNDANCSERKSSYRESIGEDEQQQVLWCMHGDRTAATTVLRSELPSIDFGTSLSWIVPMHAMAGHQSAEPREKVTAGRGRFSRQTPQPTANHTVRMAEQCFGVPHPPCSRRNLPLQETVAVDSVRGATANNNGSRGHCCCPDNTHAQQIRNDGLNLAISIARVRWRSELAKVS